MSTAPRKLWILTATLMLALAGLAGSALAGCDPTCVVLYAATGQPC